jgi:hypothetical protein
VREERAVVPGRDRELWYWVRPPQRARRLHQGGRLRELDRGGHTHAKEAVKETEEVLLKSPRPIEVGRASCEDRKDGIPHIRLLHYL